MRFDAPLESDKTMLEKIKKTTNKEYTTKQKAEWLGQLEVYADQRGYKNGWTAHKYRSKFGVWPNKITAIKQYAVSQEVSNWITHENIRRAKSA